MKLCWPAARMPFSALALQVSTFPGICFLRAIASMQWSLGYRTDSTQQPGHWQTRLQSMASLVRYDSTVHTAP